MSVRSFTQIVAEHDERLRVAAVLMADPDVSATFIREITARDQKAPTSARLFDTNVDSTVTELKPADWDQLTGRA